MTVGPVHVDASMVRPRGRRFGIRPPNLWLVRAALPARFLALRARRRAITRAHLARVSSRGSDMQRPDGDRRCSKSPRGHAAPMNRVVAITSLLGSRQTPKMMKWVLTLVFAQTGRSRAPRLQPRGAGRARRVRAGWDDPRPFVDGMALKTDHRASRCAACGHGFAARVPRRPLAPAHHATV